MQTPSPYCLAHLDSAALVARLRQIVGQGCQLTARLLAYLAEVDTRKLYREAACASMFVYCTEILHFSESAAFKRIAAARAARAFPLVYELVAAGGLHLSAVTVLAPHLTPENHEELLRAAVHKTKRETEALLAARFPRPEARAMVRRLPASRLQEAAAPAPATADAPLPPAADAPDAVPAASVPSVAPGLSAPSASKAVPAASSAAPTATGPARAAWPSRPPAPAVTPLSEARYKVQFTASEALRDKLREAQDLLRTQVPDGDLAVVLERALDTLLADLRRRKYGETSSPRPRKATAPSMRRSRHVPHAVRREVTARDCGQCTYVDPATGRRCTARAFLQFHHDETFARGGEHEVSNVRILCAAHNALLAEQDYGAAYVAKRREAARAGSECAGRHSEEKAARRDGESHRLSPGGSRSDAARESPLPPGGSRLNAAEAEPRLLLGGSCTVSPTPRGPSPASSDPFPRVQYPVPRLLDPRPRVSAAQVAGGRSRDQEGGGKNAGEEVRLRNRERSCRRGWLRARC